MFEHPQFTLDRYAHEMRRVEERLELIRMVNERRERETVSEPEAPRRSWFRRRREQRVPAMKVAPVIPADGGSVAPAVGR